jgi:hypothetical protein
MTELESKQLMIDAIQKLRKEKRQLEETCNGFAKDLQETIDTAAEIIKDCGKEIDLWDALTDELEVKVEGLQGSLALQLQFDRDFDAQISENDGLKAKIEATSKILEKISVSKNDPYWDELAQLRAILSQEKKMEVE